MDHLDEEAVTRAATVERVTLPAAERSHLERCEDCRNRAAFTARLATTLREAESRDAPAVPSFDALIAPQLTPSTEPVRLPQVSPGQALRLTVAVTLRQARLVPRLLWWLTVGGFAVVAVALTLLPQSGGAVSYLGPVTVALVTMGAVAVCDPTHDPRQESMHAMLVPPVVVWLCRLVLVLGALLLLATAVSVLAAAAPASGQQAGAVIGGWLAPALLGAALTTFGAVWRSPAVGLAFGAVSWAMSVVALRDDLFGTAVAVVWTHNGVALPLAVAALAAATWLVARPAVHTIGD